MATAIPSSLSYEMLSRLPPESFDVSWVEVRPDVAPLNSFYDLSQENNARFGFRGATNQYLLNTDISLCGTKQTVVKHKNTTTNTVTPQQKEWLIRKPFRHNDPVHLIASARESFNAAGLPYLDNQDPVVSHEVNRLRQSCIRKRVSDDNLPNNRGTWDGGVGYAAEPADLLSGVYNARRLYQVNVAGDYSYEQGLGDHPFQIDLGYFSNLVNSHSLVPLGLMSSYAVAGWQVDLRLAKQPLSQNLGQSHTLVGSGTIPASNGITAWGAPSVAGALSDASNTIDSEVVSNRLYDLRVHYKVVTILDPAVNSALLSLYEKRETVRMGDNVEFPLSMRMNSIAYRTARFPIRSGQSDYHFRIPSTDKSVRAVGFRVFNKAISAEGLGYLASSAATKRSPRITRMETMIGNERVHDCLEDYRPDSNTISNFLVQNLKQSASVFSPLPAYMEGRVWSAKPDSQLAGLINSGVSLFQADSPLAKYSSLYGIISLENMDRRTGDFSTSFQATGKNLVNVGAVEMNMRIQQIPADENVAEAAIPAAVNDKFKSWEAPSSDDYEIIFVLAHDSVMEISPTGVSDISSVVL